MPTSLSCPTCGAAAAGPDASRCDYCGSTLTSVACPACFGTMFAGMQFCPHCGAKGSRTVDDGATLSCPGCRGEMKRVQVGATTLFECGACAGNWLDAATFTQLCLSREERGAITAIVGANAIGAPKAAGGAVRYVPCPSCKRIMNRENFGRRSGVIIDVCKGDGVWFERGELQLVMSFIDGGGLERARAHEAERLAEERRLARARDGEARHSAQYQVYVVHNDTGAPNESLLVEALHILFN